MSDETCIGSKAMSVISVVMCGSLSPRFPTSHLHRADEVDF